MEVVCLLGELETVSFMEDGGERASTVRACQRYWRLCLLGVVWEGLRVYECLPRVLETVRLLG